MQLTGSADTSSVSADAPIGLRTDVVDRLFAALGIHGPTAQAAALGLGKSHWIRIRSGKVQPLGVLLVRVAEYLGTSTGAIYGRPES